jgi:phosphate transport system substrate-binding protein
MRTTILSSVAVLALVAGGCKSKNEGPVSKEGGSGPASAGSTEAPKSGGTVDLTGAGATFPYPLYSKWIAEYQKVDAKVTINYQSIGSGGGIKQITEKTVDFGASDAPMKDEELAKVQGALLHFPTTLGAVVLAYNLPDVKDPLKLTPDVVAGIYLGDIKTWNDKKIADANPGVKLPSDAINVAYRSDGSGTTAVFTGYLAAISGPWKDKVGAGKSVSFPVGSGAKGNDGVAGVIKTTPGTIGYVELAYAKQTALPYAQVQNAAGKFVTASPDSVSAAAAGVADKIPDDFRISIVNAPGDGAYPISSFTYLLVYQDATDAAKGKALAQFLWWALHDGQKLGPALDYAPLPDAIVKKEEAKLHSLTAKGQALLPAT